MKTVLSTIALCLAVANADLGLYAMTLNIPKEQPKEALLAELAELDRLDSIDNARNARREKPVDRVAL